MDNYQFELGGYQFGIGQDITVEGFDPGTVGWTTQDQPNPITDGTTFGQDKMEGPTWAWDLSTDRDEPEEALATASELATIWRALGVRDVPGAVMPLRYSVGGRTRRVYGRPRRWSAPPSNRLLGGYLPINADFAVADHLHYDDEEATVTLTITGSATGGLEFPAEAPFLFSGTGQERPGLIYAGGDAPTGFTARIDGPIVGPYLRGPGWELDFGALSLPEGQWIDIDTHSFGAAGMTALRNGVASVAGSLSRLSRLSKAKIVPGGQEIVFGGTSATGTASAAIHWRPAWHSL